MFAYLSGDSLSVWTLYFLVFVSYKCFVIVNSRTVRAYYLPNECFYIGYGPFPSNFYDCFNQSLKIYWHLWPKSQDTLSIYCMWGTETQRFTHNRHCLLPGKNLEQTQTVGGRPLTWRGGISFRVINSSEKLNPHDKNDRNTRKHFTLHLQFGSLLGTYHISA